MAPYVCLNLSLAFLWILSNGKRRKYTLSVKQYVICRREDIFFAVATIVIALFMGLRGTFTSDHRSYKLLFNETIQKSIQDILFHKVYMERGYLLLNKLIGFFTNDANAFICIEAIAFIIIIMKVARKYRCNDFLLFVLLFVNAGIYFQAFNMIRQALVAGIVFIALWLLGNGNIKGYILVVLLAATVHTSSIIMLAALPLLKLKINIKNGLKMTVIGIVTVASIGKIIEFVQKFRYANYSYGMGHGTVNAFLVQWILCIIVIIAIYNKTIDVEDKHNVVLINSMWMYLIFSFATLSVYQMSRICYFFSTPMLLLVSQSFEKWKGKTGIILRIALVGMLILYSYVWLSGTGYEPYYTFL